MVDIIQCVKQWKQWQPGDLSTLDTVFLYIGMGVRQTNNCRLVCWERLHKNRWDGKKAQQTNKKALDSCDTNLSIISEDIVDYGRKGAK